VAKNQLVERPPDPAGVSAKRRGPQKKFVPFAEIRVFIIPG